MSTSYMPVFQAFLARIEDEFFAEAAEALAQEQLISMLNVATFRFPFPRVDITNKDDVAMVFNVILTNAEIQTMAILMKHEWIRRQVAGLQNIRQRYSERDFEQTSQANHLKALLELDKAVGQEAKDALRLYHRAVNNQPSPIYGRLASKEGQ